MKWPTVLSCFVLFGLFGLAGASVAEESDPLFGILNAKLPEEGVVFGGQPSRSQLEALADAGYVVIDLRTPQEDRGFDQAALAGELGLEYINIPVSSFEDADAYDKFMAAFAEASRPVLVHCRSGNRVAAMYYAYLVSEAGVARDEALEKALAAGLSRAQLADQVDAFLASRD